MDQFRFLGKLPTYPSPKLTFALTSHLGQNDGLEEGRWAVSPKPKLILTFIISSKKQERNWAELTFATTFGAVAGDSKKIGW